MLQVPDLWKADIFGFASNNYVLVDRKLSLYNGQQGECWSIEDLMLFYHSSVKTH
jgi:hypothetical protein